MDMYSRNQYLKTLIEKRGYLLRSRKEKSKLLDEYCQTTGQNRNYVIRKIRAEAYLKQNFGKRKGRNIIMAMLKKLWFRPGESLTTLAVKDLNLY